MKYKCYFLSHIFVILSIKLFSEASGSLAESTLEEPGKIGDFPKSAQETHLLYREVTMTKEVGCRFQSAGIDSLNKCTASLTTIERAE